MTLFVDRPDADDGELRTHDPQPPGVRPVAAAVVGEFQDRGVKDQVRGRSSGINMRKKCRRAMPTTTLGAYHFLQGRIS